MKKRKKWKNDHDFAEFGPKAETLCGHSAHCVATIFLYIFPLFFFFSPPCSLTHSHYILSHVLQPTPSPFSFSCVLSSFVMCSTRRGLTCQSVGNGKSYGVGAQLDDCVGSGDMRGTLLLRERSVCGNRPT